VIDAAQATDAEIAAAVAVSKSGRGPVVLRDPIDGRRTSDLLINGVPYDIYRPKAGTSTTAMKRYMGTKNDQCSGIVLDISQTDLPLSAFEGMLKRVRNDGALNITEIIIVGK
jgi:hypothetical protein